MLDWLEHACSPVTFVTLGALTLGSQHLLSCSPSLYRTWQTGGGKSLCFTVPALVQQGLVLVVSPLIGEPGALTSP